MTINRLVDLVISVGATLGIIVVIDHVMVAWRAHRLKRETKTASRTSSARSPVEVLSPSVEKELLTLENRIADEVRQVHRIATAEEVDANVDRIMDMVAELSNVAVDRHFEAAGSVQ